MGSSLKINLTASATGCKSPNGPTRFGPSRSWMNAEPRRSTQTKIGTIVNRALITTTTFTAVMRRSKNMIFLIPAESSFFPDIKVANNENTDK